MTDNKTNQRYRANGTALEMKSGITPSLLSISLFLLTATVAIPARLSAQQHGNVVHIAFTAQRWHASSTVEPSDSQFVTKEGFPDGLLILKQGSVVLDNLSFADGVIEFDMKPIAEDMSGIQFRTQGPPELRNAEEFYIRSSVDCRASDDCVQYAPVINGFMLWNFYPQYQTRAFVLDGWNHIKLVISGQRMNVYLNQQLEPALAVGELEGKSRAGGIELQGPAYFANFTVRPRDTGGLSAQPLPDPVRKDLNIVRKWRLGPLTNWNRRDVKYSDKPSSSLAWKVVMAERFGVVNLNREFTLSQRPPLITWMQTTVTSDRDQVAHVSLAWLGQAWIFVNGQFVSSAKNFYYPSAERRNPDGRLSFENGSFDLPLRHGTNEIVISAFNSIHDDPTKLNRYGWGLGMRFDSVAGVHFEK